MRYFAAPPLVSDSHNRSRRKRRSLIYKFLSSTSIDGVFLPCDSALCLCKFSDGLWRKSQYQPLSRRYEADNPGT
uniref:General transcription factor IIH subunit 5 n=1 Tax=Rhizophora mucronata TaxID=61149 RepID=A0A2P2JE14_RHIMU